VLITGRGPLREKYEPRLVSRKARHVQVRAVWLADDDYVRLVGCADLGISVHRSASGLDLPMKIADLFGGSTPVAALDYGPCLREMIREGENGLLFATSDELAGHLCDLADGDRAHAARFAHLRQGAAASAAVRWEDGWAAEAWPVLGAHLP
jgi:beta-1,4-mannosyltransferase